MNRIAIAVILLSVAVGASPFIADETLVEKNQVISMNMSATVVQANNSTAESIQAGVNPGKNMEFGEVPKDVEVTKFLEVSSGGGKIMLSIEAEGNITQHLTYKELQTIEGEERVDIKFTPSELGYYNGHLTVKTIVPKNSLGEKWLEIRPLFF